MTYLLFIVLTNVQLIGIIVSVVVMVAVALILAAKAQKSRRLRTRFGPEYSRAVQESGSATRGEERLAQLEQRVERSDSFAATAMKRLAEQFAGERSKLEGQWNRGGDVSTEDLRVALRRYRSFFGRLLAA